MNHDCSSLVILPQNTGAIFAAYENKNKREMRRFYLPVILALAAQICFSQTRDKDLDIPDLDNYQTLKCDFHIHTVFSDGLVWPTVRVDEAYAEGLDAIALTEHIEYRPHKQDIQADHNRSYELIKQYAKDKDVILIKGSEITRDMAPGHHNAIYINDSEPLDTPDYMNAFKAAKAQGAFIFWNHPGWDAQQPEETKWWDVHTQLYDGGYMQGIEVANGSSYFPEAQQWCLDKKLTMIGNSDIHQPIQTDIDFSKGEHRTMTLVFAKERSAEGIREALNNRRTAVFVGEKIIGEEAWLKELFKSAVKVEKVNRGKNSVQLVVYNNSDLTFYLKKGEHDPNLTYFREYKIAPKCKHTISVRLKEPATSGHIDFEVTNLLVSPNKGLDYQLFF